LSSCKGNVQYEPRISSWTSVLEDLVGGTTRKPTYPSRTCHLLVL
jgi:hypothetical protein